MILKSTASNGQIQCRMLRHREQSRLMAQHGLTKAQFRYRADGTILNIMPVPPNVADATADHRARLIATRGNPRRRAVESLGDYHKRLRAAVALMRES